MISKPVTFPHVWSVEQNLIIIFIFIIVSSINILLIMNVSFIFVHTQKNKGKGLEEVIWYKFKTNICRIDQIF